MTVGAAGEFTIWLDGQLVANKTPDGFPSPEDVVAAVKAALPTS